MDVLYDAAFQRRWMLNDSQVACAAAGMLPVRLSCGSGASSSGGSGGVRPAFVLTNSVDENWGFLR